MTLGTKGQTTWFVLKGEQTFWYGITVKGEVNLILCDGADIDVSGGVQVASGSTLNIYPGSTGNSVEGTGTLTAYGKSGGAGIGGSNSDGFRDCGTVAIHGGSVTANGGFQAAGIGGSCGGGAGGTVTIYGGVVNATSNLVDYSWTGGAGIGGGGSYGNGGTVTIHDGTVNANGGDCAAGIDGGSDGAGDTVIINSGTVNATGNFKKRQ